VVQGILGTVSRSCPCTPAVTGPFDWKHQRLSGSVGCAGVAMGFNSVPLAFPLPPLPTGFSTLSLGAWSGPPAVFPGTRDLNVHWGVLQYQDPCNTADPPIHVVQGVSTSGVVGQLFGPTPPPQYKVFLDLQNMILPTALSGGPLAPGWGCLFFSKTVWNLNL
jgi:hypothetical protein